MCVGLTIVDVARICHEANRAYCQALGDHSQREWSFAEEWQRQSAIKGVEFRLDNPDVGASGQHEAWCDSKVADGWKYGPIKDAEKKEHPCLVEYDRLPIEQRFKDTLFQAGVDAMEPALKIDHE